MANLNSRPGERNPQCVLSDRDVELLRQLWDSEANQRETDGSRPRTQRKWTYATLAVTFEISRRQVANILSYAQRGTTSDQAEVMGQ